MQLMSFNTSSVPNRMDVMHNAMDYMDAYEFEGDEYHYPIGVFDYKYNTMDENLNRKNGNINFKDAMYRPQNNRLELKERTARSEEHTSELQSRPHLVCRLLLEKKKQT